MDSWLATLDGLLLFSGALICLGVALTLLGAWLRRSSPWLATTGTGFAVLATIPVAMNILFATNLFGLQFMPPLMAIGVLGTSGSATILAIALLRSHALPRRFGMLMLLVGAFTFPLVIVLGMLSGTLLPAYVSDEMPFAIVGIQWVMIGLGLVRNA
jgi:hypothetical protein